MSIIYLLVILFILKIVYDISYFFMCKYYFYRYIKWIKNNKGNIPSKSMIIELFKKTNVPNSTIPILEDVGYGRLMQTTGNLFDNIFSKRNDIVSMVYQNFTECKAILKTNIILNFSPVYWINFIIFLPNKILYYLGINEKSILNKIFLVIYWILVFIFGIYKTQLKNVLMQILNNL